MLKFEEVKMLAGLAHVKWFSEGSESSSIASLTSTEWLMVAGFLILGVLLMWLVNKLMLPYDKKIDDRLNGLRDWVPTAIRYSTALLLIFNFWQEYLFAPNIEHSGGSLYSLISAVLVLIALMLLFGVFTRLSGAMLIAVFALSVVVTNDSLQLLDHLEYIGLGLYLIFAAPGKLSVQTKLSDPLKTLSSGAWLATPLLKTFAGIGLIVLAFSEKLMNMALSNDFLLEHHWNFLSSFGMSDRNFIIMAGIIEILVGLTLVLNLAPRLGTLSLLSVMIITAVLLGIDEVFGHMFAVAVVAAVWVGPNESLFRKQRS